MKKLLRLPPPAPLLAGCLLVVLALFGVRPDEATAQPARVTLCHILTSPPSTLDVPAHAVGAHLAHGDYLGPCLIPSPVPTNTPTPTETGTPVPPTPIPVPVEPEPQPLFNMYLLTRGGWHCLLISDTHPSIERQNQACFPHLDPNWTATNAPCAAPVYDDDTWDCDNYTPWRLSLSRLRVVWERHISKVQD